MKSQDERLADIEQRIQRLERSRVVQCHVCGVKMFVRDRADVLVDAARVAYDRLSSHVDASDPTLAGLKKALDAF